MSKKLYWPFSSKRGVRELSILLLGVTFFYCAWPGPDRKIWDNPFDPTNPNRAHPPQIVYVTKDTSIGVNDTLWVNVRAVSENANILYYLWSLDNGYTIDTTEEGKYPFLWSKNDTGQKIISIWAINEYNMYSNQVLVKVIVKNSKPLLSKLSDTLVSEKAKVVKVFSATDNDGKIVKYYWSTKDKVWEDSVSVNNTSFVASFSKDKSWVVSVRWAAVDDDSLFTEDTFRIFFNRGPDSVWLAGKDTLSFVSYSHVTNSGVVKCVFNSHDPDTIDTISYNFIVFNSQNDTILRYTGKDSSVLLTDVKPNTRYSWKIVAKDLFGDSVTSNGNFWTSQIPSPPLGMKLIVARDKYFKMGQSGFDSSEIPIHTVGFSYSFWIDTIEVTNEQYAKVMGLPLSDSASANFPVTNISWYDAILYCNVKSKIEKRDTVYVYTLRENKTEGVILDDIVINYNANGYRLPTEAEWEYACRKDSLTLFFWGNNPTESFIYAWTKENSGNEKHKCATKMPNVFGLYDMAGNVWEWCNDWFDPLYYTKSPLLDPVGPQSGTERVIRGGSFNTSLYFSQCGTRSKISPLTKSNEIGFRTVLVER